MSTTAEGLAEILCGDIPADIPPLSQSGYETMACPESYVFSRVDGYDDPGSAPAREGREVHEVLLAYTNHCIERRTLSDWEAFDRILAGHSEGAAAILLGFRENFFVPWKSAIATEQHLALDAHMRPILHGSTERAHYEGTPDLVLYEGQGLYRIIDYKNYWMIAEPKTFQSKLYPYLVMQHYPNCEAVEFSLVFTRYGATRSVSYTRADLPALHDMIQRERARQIAMHLDRERYRTDARPGKNCIYCPKLRAKTCSLSGQGPSRNDYELMSYQDRLQWQGYLLQAVKANRELLRGYVEECGPLTVEDANGNRIAAAPEQKERRSYPLVPVLEALEDWKHATAGEKGFPPEGEDLALKLEVSSTKFKQYLKANKRADLDQQIQTIVQIKPYSEFSIKIGGADDGAEEEGQ